MERLTTINDMGIAVYKQRYQCERCGEDFWRLPDLGSGSPTDRLAEYEELEEQGKIQRNYEIGQWIFGIEEEEVGGYLFMAECGDYIICTPEFMHCNGDIKRQLMEMYKDSLNNYGVEVHMLNKNLTFTTCEEAEAALKEIINQTEI